MLQSKMTAGPPTPGAARPASKHLSSAALRPAGVSTKFPRNTIKKFATTWARLGRSTITTSTHHPRLAAISNGQSACPLAQPIADRVELAFAGDSRTHGGRNIQESERTQPAEDGSIAEEITRHARQRTPIPDSNKTLLTFLPQRACAPGSLALRLDPIATLEDPSRRIFVLALSLLDARSWRRCSHRASSSQTKSGHRMIPIPPETRSLLKNGSCNALRRP